MSDINEIPIEKQGFFRLPINPPTYQKTQKRFYEDPAQTLDGSLSSSVQNQGFFTLKPRDIVEPLNIMEENEKENVFRGNTKLRVSQQFLGNKGERGDNGSHQKVYIYIYIYSSYALGAFELIYIGTSNLFKRAGTWELRENSSIVCRTYEYHTIL